VTHYSPENTFAYSKRIPKKNEVGESER